MRITIPTLDDGGLEAQVASHFGRSAYFTTVETETEEVSVRQNQGHHFGGSRSPAEDALNAGAEAIACAGLGRKALQHFHSSGIKVYTDAKGTVRDVLEAVRNENLPRATEESACPGRHGEQ